MTKDLKSIPLSEPVIRGNEWKYVKNCLDSGWVSSAGDYVIRFEEVVASYIGSKHAVACVSGTAALHVALLVSGITADDEVILPDISFVAPANALRYIGAYPVFVDVQPDIWQMDPSKIERFLSEECENIQGALVNKNTKRIVKAILPVHILGHPVDMDPVCALARQYNLVVIEDAAESIGALYKDRKVGSIGHVGCLSFNGNKIITAGGGGMMVTDNVQWADRARYLTTQSKDDVVESIHHEIGYNYRLTNIQAALGLAQMECLDSYIAQKRSMAHGYAEGLAGIDDIRLPMEADWARSIYWLYTIIIETRQEELSSRSLLKEFAGLGVQTRPLWCPLHRLRPFRDCYAHDISVADRLYQRALSLPSSVGLAKSDQSLVTQTIQRFFKQLSKSHC